MSVRNKWIVAAGLLGLAGASAAWLWPTSASSIASAAEEQAARLCPGPAPSADAQTAQPEHAALIIAEPESSPGAARPRAQGYFTADPGTLVALRGRVIGQKSDLAIGGIELSFLSRRPQTVRARSDASGGFSTGLELASGVITVMHIPDPADARFATRRTRALRGR